MDSTYRSILDGDVLSTNFRVMAETLPEDRIAVLRYNKRGVLPDGEIDAGQVQASTLDRLADDLNAVIDEAQTLDEVGDMYLYGWKEGAWVVSNVAVERDDVSGLVLQGAPDGDIASILPYQIQEVMLPHLRDVVDTDEDGTLTLEEVGKMSPGVATYHASFFLYEPNSNGDVLNSFVNRDGDDGIHIEDELIPAIDMYLSNVPQYIPEGDASYMTSELVAALNMPVLLLHGEMDGWVPISHAEHIADAENATLERYPELGHALSESEAPALDAFYPMDSAPLDTLAAWISE